MKSALVLVLSLLPSLSYACLFGADLVEMARMRDLKASEQKVLKAPSALSSLQKKQIIAGMRASLHESKTIEAALEATDDGRFLSRRIWDSAHRQAYILYVYSAGDNMHGFITRAESAELVAQIGDGQISAKSCKVGFENYDSLPWFYTN